MGLGPIQYRDGKFKAGDLVEFRSNGRSFTALLLEDPRPPNCGNYPFSFKILCDEYDKGTSQVVMHTEQTGYPREKLA